ncbi:SPOR domain-containing protein [Tateyamaria sp. SN3-11]|uniref:SPOR domain-containing protein n=1 Tax=Tateyamaria sp. SN3-11 TaxID=3092147 RepID=UPI0039E7C7BA
MGHVGYSTPETTSTPPSNPLKNITNLAGAAVSLALIAGVSVWGYKLVMRDVSGIPVVRAAEGEMRVRPADPGGQLAQNTGLAVNEVAAAGEASGPVDRLVLAPKPMDLSEEDQPMTAQTVAPVQQPEPLDLTASFDAAPKDVPKDVDVAEALNNGAVEDLVNQLTAGVDAIEAEEGETKPVLASVSTADVPIPAPVATVTGPGPKLSKRPQLRPVSAPAVVVPVAAIAAAQEIKELDGSAIPAGTRLVQLGAFDSPEVARAQWDKMQGRFGDYLQGKDRIVQKAQSGGRTFYRLRAHGFADLSDARRFCSALVAEGADCIPVVTR